MAENQNLEEEAGFGSVGEQYYWRALPEDLVSKIVLIYDQYGYKGRLPLPEDFSTFDDDPVTVNAIKHHAEKVLRPAVERVLDSISEDRAGELGLPLAAKSDAPLENLTNELRNAQKIIRNLRAEKLRDKANIQTLIKYGRGMPEEQTLRDLAAQHHIEASDRTNVSAVARALGKDRKTAKKWLARYKIR